MLLQALYFFVPAYTANMAPVFAKNINFLNKPVDLGKMWRKKRILGDHKTYRGFFFGTLFAIIAFEIQRILYNNNIMRGFALIDYSAAPVFLGALIGFSALFGDSLKSFFKRRLDISSGRPWVPFDQLDFIVISIIATLPWSNIPLADSLLVLVSIFFLNIVVQYAGYRLKLKKDVL